MWHCHEKCCWRTGPWTVFSIGCEVLGTSCSNLPKQHPVPIITQPGCNPSLDSFTTGAHSLSELVPFWQGNNLMLSNICCVASFFSPSIQGNVSDPSKKTYMIQWLSRPDPDYPIQKISSSKRPIYNSAFALKCMPHRMWTLPFALFFSLCGKFPWLCQV